MYIPIQYNMARGGHDKMIKSGLSAVCIGFPKIKNLIKKHLYINLNKINDLKSAALNISKSFCFFMFTVPKLQYIEPAISLKSPV